MCGIAGILRISPAQHAGADADIPESWLDVLEGAIAHRGPDGRGRLRDRVTRADGTLAQVALVHRRLSILDHQGGAQPMRLAPTATDGALAVVFNGCIYNHRQIRDDLRSRAQFASDHSDTEALLHLFRARGPGMTGKLIGMWAMAMWDGATGELWLGRDPAGEKPLYWHQTRMPDGTRVLWFASTPSGVQALGARLGVSVRASEPADLAQWVRFGASDRPASGACRAWPVGGGLQSLQAVGDGRLEAPAPVPARRTKATLDEQELDDLLARCVGQQLESDVPLGCFLSGGIDSGVVAAHAQRALRAQGRGALRTFTVRMPAGSGVHDESALALATARYLGTHHTTLDCEADGAETLVRLIEQLGLPFGDSSLLPSAWLSRAARQHVTVAIGGDGGDELFGGYRRHVAARRAARWAGLGPALAEVGACMLPEAGAWLRLGRAGERAQRALAGLMRGYDELRATINHDLLAQLLPGARAAVEPVALGLDPRAIDPLNADFVSYLGPDLLVKTDTATMAVALELRSPLLHQGFTARVRQEPIDHLMGATTKGLLKRVAARHLPGQLLNQPKMGFAIPIGTWFRSNYGGLRTLLHDVLGSAEAFGPDWVGVGIDRRVVRRLLDEHMGTGVHTRPVADHGQRLYVLLCLALWARWLGRLGAGGGGGAGRGA